MTLDEHGVLQGESEVFHPETGKKVFAMTWVDGKNEGENRRFHHESGKLLAVSHWKEGVIHGETVQYGDAGETLTLKANFTAGKLNGLFESYDANGNLKKKTTYVDGVDQQMVAKSVELAKEIIASGYDYRGIDAVSGEIFNSLECIEREGNKSNANDTQAEIERRCELKTAASYAAEQAQEAAEINAHEAELAAAEEAAAVASDEYAASVDRAVEAAQAAVDTANAEAGY